jgi:hypothetical protein
MAVIGIGGRILAQVFRKVMQLVELMTGGETALRPEPFGSTDKPQKECFSES